MAWPDHITNDRSSLIPTPQLPRKKTPPRVAPPPRVEHPAGNPAAIPTTVGPTHSKKRHRGATCTQYAKQEGANEIKHPGRNAGVPQHVATSTGAKMIGTEKFSAQNSQHSTIQRHWQVYGIQEDHVETKLPTTLTQILCQGDRVIVTGCAWPSRRYKHYVYYRQARYPRR